ncbi:peroxiredoxin family protein [Streptosporangium carneum]|uniref:TlpA family protein n=1 Tax=Streptosporangium carneum TaxID=47481 RepID=A0A9W6I1B0_9ACTN|nr:TlpA disulfide reductase family protein [Streptosporangium carneum]GLK09434.1 TlpA family protein [Streptosporangium carneum]
MPYLTAAVVLVGLLCAANTVLMLGVVRRLREHEARLPAAGGFPSLGLPPVGAVLPSFSAVCTTGERIGSADLPLPAVIAFFDVGCEPCQEKAPRFADEATSLPELNVLSVVVGEPGAMSAALELAGPVVVEAEEGGVSRAFGVRGFPAMCLVDENGRIAESGGNLSLPGSAATLRKAARR